MIIETSVGRSCPGQSQRIFVEYRASGGKSTRLQYLLKDSFTWRRPVKLALLLRMSSCVNCMANIKTPRGSEVALELQLRPFFSKQPTTLIYCPKTSSHGFSRINQLRSHPYIHCSLHFFGYSNSYSEQRSPSGRRGSRISASHCTLDPRFRNPFQTNLQTPWSSGSCQRSQSGCWGCRIPPSYRTPDSGFRSHQTCSYDDSTCNRQDGFNSHG